MTNRSFPDAVSERCGQPAREVTSVLSAAHVPTTDSGARPHRLRVIRLAFTGKKAGLHTDDISFDHEFGDGLWAISTERNDAGKTSILEIIMWCLRGEPKRLQDDVRAWLHTVKLEGLIDDDSFVVSFDDTGPEPDGNLTVGNEVRPFSSEAAFADTMSQLMMERLGFESFDLWVSGQGMATHHWPSYSTVLYLPREAEGAVIGDTTGHGVTQQLVQLFVGIPWARTYSACRAARRESEDHDAAGDIARSSIVETATEAISDKQRELAEIRTQLADLPSGTPSDADIASAETRWVSLIDEHSRARSDLRDAQNAASNAEHRARRARRRLQDVTEAALARRLFHGLNPSRCPRCSVEIDSQRRDAERAHHSCAVCDRELDLDLDVTVDDRPIHPDDADDAPSRDELQQLVRDLDQVAEREGARVVALEGNVQTLASQVDEAKEAFDAYRAQATRVQERRALESRVAALEAVISELSQLTADEQSELPERRADPTRLEVLRAAEAEAKERRDEAFGEIVGEINSAILDLARRFGFATLQEAKLNLGAQLRLVKGGAQTSFRYQTPGEKLRLRIAVIVALLRVGHLHHVGRHPGLLLIDSIGAEETEPGNLGEFMRELEAVTRELGIETIVASARPEILEHVPAAQQVAVTGDAYLW